MERVRQFLQLPDTGAPDGANVRVAVIDSGIDQTHADLRHATDGRRSKDCRPDHKDLTDRWAHGTAIAGIIAGRGRLASGRYRGLAPAATLLIYKVFEGREGVLEPDLQRALQFAVRAKADIINLSCSSSPLDDDALGGPIDRVQPPWVWSASLRLGDYLLEATRCGVLCVVSAGNDGQHGRGTINRAGGSEGCLAVGACDLDGRHHPNSSRGPYYVDATLERDRWRRLEDSDRDAQIRVIKPDLVAPGVGVWTPLSAHSVDLRAEVLADPRSEGGAYYPFTGTSVAAAVVSGLAACTLGEVRKWRPTLPARSQARLLLGLLREAARASCTSEAELEEMGNGVLRWPAIAAAIERCRSDEEYFRDLLNPPL
ncbi:MAG TPA: S8 family serine peptidase [Longimicrobiaceae bacterium]|nr:S8 family serine peptidase [Longimicrobiaceae bacterium]